MSRESDLSYGICPVCGQEKYLQPQNGLVSRHYPKVRPKGKAMEICQGSYQAPERVTTDRGYAVGDIARLHEVTVKKATKAKKKARKPRKAPAHPPAPVETRWEPTPRQRAFIQAQRAHGDRKVPTKEETMARTHAKDWGWCRYCYKPTAITAQGRPYQHKPGGKREGRNYTVCYPGMEQSATHDEPAEDAVSPWKEDIEAGLYEKNEQGLYELQASVPEEIDLSRPEVSQVAEDLTNYEIPEEKPQVMAEEPVVEPEPAPTEEMLAVMTKQLAELSLELIDAYDKIAAQDRKLDKQYERHYELTRENDQLKTTVEVREARIRLLEAALDAEGSHTVPVVEPTPEWKDEVLRASFPTPEWMKKAQIKSEPETRPGPTWLEVAELLSAERKRITRLLASEQM